MNTIKWTIILLIGSLLMSCSESVMDEINENQSSTKPTSMTADNLVPDAILKSAFETTSTDIAWYTSVYIEHNAGTWNQLADADRRIGQESASLMNNSWNSLYNVMNICKSIIDKTDPEQGEESLNYSARGIARMLMAYNLAMATDMWGKVPFSEAFQGQENLKPTYEEQEHLYPLIFAFLDSAISNLNKAESINAEDFLYAGSKENWIKAAHALKARFSLRLTNVEGNAAAQNALDAIDAGGFTSAADDMLMHYAGYPHNNPWFSFYYSRSQHSISTTFFNLLNDRTDPRLPYLVATIDGEYLPAPIGEAEETQGGYSQSMLYEYGYTAPTPMMTYHEQKFIEAEAKFRLNDPTWETALREAISESFNYLGNTYYGSPVAGADQYFTNEVQPRLTPGNELEVIMTQKYIAMFEHECIQSYNDYRRTGYPVMQNPKNQTVGFPHRLPYALSETQSNPDNVPDVSIYEDRIWWAQKQK